MATRNKITDLNNHLYAQLERLGEEDITPEELELEISRSKAITSIATTVVQSFSVTVQAMTILQKSGADITPLSTNLLGHKTE